MLLSEVDAGLSVDNRSIRKAYTGIWQSADPHEQEWIDEVFGPVLKNQITDGKHELVLDNAILFDAFVYCYDTAYYRQFRGKNAFLVHFLDENFQGAYEEIYCNFRGVFRCHWADVFNPEYVMKFPIGYCSGMSRGKRTLLPATQRKYLWSFVGHAGKSSRPDMARFLAPIEPHFLFSTDTVGGLSFLNTIDGQPKRLTPAESFEILLESTFSPCPMGNVQVECFRLYEVLESGSIPIIEKRMTLDYFRDLLGEHPIPTVRSWREAREMIRRMLLNPHEIDILQERCVEWWAHYKQEYRGQVEDFLSRRAADVEPLEGRIMTRKYSMPGWRTIELLRHHDMRAFSRRVQKQAARLIHQGKFRVAHRPGTDMG